MQVIKNHRFKKYLGQNFLRNKDISKKIVNSIGDDFRDLNILEIGPGQGSLTEFIVEKKPKSIILIEKDQDLINNLNLKFPNIKILNNDVLKIKLKEISNLDEKFTIISNLPYNIGTILIMQWLQELDYITKIVIMLQKEVVIRFLSKPGSKSYGITSVLLQTLCDLEFVMNVSRKNFYPEPNVESSVIKIIPKKNFQISEDEFKKFSDFIHLLFNQRRRKIGTILKNNKVKLSESYIKYLDFRAEDLSWEVLLDLFRSVVY